MTPLDSLVEDVGISVWATKQGKGVFVSGIVGGEDIVQAPMMTVYFLALKLQWMEPLRYWKMDGLQLFPMWQKFTMIALWQSALVTFFG